MIVEETLIYKPNKLPFKTGEIENFILSKGINPIRWSINKKEGDSFYIQVSGIKN